MISEKTRPKISRTPIMIQEIKSFIELEVRELVIKILNQIYNLDCIHEVKINKNIKKIFTYADKNNFDFILLIGEEEESKNKIILKNLNTKEQKIFNQSEIKLLNEIR